MKIKVENIAVITLTEDETRLWDSGHLLYTFDCDYIKKQLEYTADANLKVMLKQVFGVLMQQDAWFCKIVPVLLLDDAIVPEVVTPQAVTPQAVKPPVINPAPKIPSRDYTRVLFLNTVNGSQYKNPIAVLVQINNNITDRDIRELENQLFVCCRVLDQHNHLRK